MEKNTLTIDIGNRHIKMLWGNYKAAKLYLHGFSVIDTPPDALNDEGFADITALAQVIEREIIGNRIRPKEVIFTLSGQGIIARDIQLPKSTDKEIEKILRFDVEQFFPIDLKEYTYDFKPMEQITIDGQEYSRVMLVAVQEKKSDDYMELADILGLKVSAIDINQNCIFKMVHNRHLPIDKGDESADSEYSIIDLGHKTTNLANFANQVMQFYRIMAFGNHEIDLEIQQLLNVDYSEADAYKRDKLNLIASGLQNDLLRSQTASRLVLDRMLNDLRRLNDFYRTNFAYSVNTIYLCGGGGRIPGIAQYFSEYLAIPTQIITFDHLVNVKYTNKKDINRFKDNIGLLIPPMGAFIRS